MAVTTSLVNGTLTITGDAAADDIAIVGTPHGELTITGRNGTPVDGIPDSSFTIAGVLGSLNVNLNGGDDALSLDNIFIAGSITVDSGDGDDLVTLAASHLVTSRSSLNIKTGPGNDQVEELNYEVFVGGSHLINLGAGDDWATVIGASAAGGGVSSGISVQGGDGSDSILGVGLVAIRDVNVEGGNEVNSIALLYSSAAGIWVSSGGGAVYLDTNYSATLISIEGRGSAGVDSSVNVFHCSTAQLFITLGQSNNIVRVYANLITGNYASRGGEPGTVLGGLYIAAARHSSDEPPYTNRNSVEIDYNIGERTWVFLGDGDDSLALIGNLMTEKTELDGYGGVNRIVDRGNSLGVLMRRNFAS